MVYCVGYNLWECKIPIHYLTKNVCGHGFESLRQHVAPLTACPDVTSISTFCITTEPLVCLSPISII